MSSMIFVACLDGETSEVENRESKTQLMNLFRAGLKEPLLGHVCRVNRLNYAFGSRPRMHCAILVCASMNMWAFNFSFIDHSHHNNFGN